MADADARAREDFPGGDFRIEERVRPKYHYSKVHESTFGFYVLEVTASTFGSIWIRDNEQTFFKKLFSTEGEGRRLQALHHARPNDICASIQVTKCSVAPTQTEPTVRFPPNANKVVQYMLLDERGFREVLDYLPYFEQKIIPWVEANSARSPEVQRPSSDSTMTMTRQIKCSRTLVRYAEASLDMGVVPFDAGPSLELRYRTSKEGQPRAGVYLSKALMALLLQARADLYNSLDALGEAGPWTPILTDFSLDGGDEAEGAASKRPKTD